MSIAYDVANAYSQAAEEILPRDIQAVKPKFEIAVLGLPFKTWRAARNANKLPLFVSGWLEDIHDPNDWLVPYVQGSYASWQSLPPDLVKPLSVFINQGAQETDPAKRAAIYQQFNRAFYDAAPDILLAVQRNRFYEQRWV